MNSRRSLLVGCGAYLPERILENSELAKIVDTSDDWIIKRTGIRQRHVAADGEFTSDLAIRAAHDALVNANMAIDQIDLIVVDDIVVMFGAILTTQRHHRRVDNAR